MVIKMQKIRSYTELSHLKTFEERFEYLKLDGKVGETSLGFDRYLSQMLYGSIQWGWIRNEVIMRDLGCDLGCDTKDEFGNLIHEIEGPITIHHMNAITTKDLENNRAFVLNPEYLICTSFRTHRAIHYGDENLLDKPLVERQPGDTTPWRK